MGNDPAVRIIDNEDGDYSCDICGACPAKLIEYPFQGWGGEGSPALAMICKRHTHRQVARYEEDYLDHKSRLVEAF